MTETHITIHALAPGTIDETMCGAKSKWTAHDDLSEVDCKDCHAAWEDFQAWLKQKRESKEANK